MTQIKLTTNDIKTFNKFINEPNEFKRYILLNLFINQYFSKTIINTITKTINNFNANNLNNNNNLSDETIFNMMRDIKQNLINQNENLKLVVLNLKNQNDIINVLNNVLSLDLTNEIMNNNKLDELEQTIKNNLEYINKIGNLSETQIRDIRHEQETDKN